MQNVNLPSTNLQSTNLPSTNLPSTNLPSTNLQYVTSQKTEDQLQLGGGLKSRSIILQCAITLERPTKNYETSQSVT